VAYVDETARGKQYGVAAVLVCSCRRRAVERSLRGAVRPGQRRLHFAKEGNTTRRALLSQIGAMEVSALYVSTQDIEVAARSACLTQLVPKLAKIGVHELVIEQLDGAERRDNHDIRLALASLGAAAVGFTYRHADPHHEPLLWIADAIAWSLGAGGDWARRVQPIMRPQQPLTTRSPTPHRPEKSRAHFRS
jgi:hypothetical protein